MGTNHDQTESGTNHDRRVSGTNHEKLLNVPLGNARKLFKDLVLSEPVEISDVQDTILKILSLS